MVRLLILALSLSLPALAASIRLFLKDGSHHVVREYTVLADRVRYYSLERSDWEEVPLDLVDLKRTESERKQREETVKSEAAAVAAEEKVEREQARQIARIPQETGVYFIAGGQLASLKQAESKVVTNRKRSVLKVLSPIPIVAGKATVELEGVTSAFVVNSDRPEFYFRLAEEERFGIVRLKPTKTARIVQNWSIVPVTKEIVDEMEQVEIFRQAAGHGVYKIWPKAPLAPGEYAVVEYTEGKGNIQVWDFAVRLVR